MYDWKPRYKCRACDLDFVHATKILALAREAEKEVEVDACPRCKSTDLKRLEGG